MKIRNVPHGGLRRLFLRDDPRGVAPSVVDKLRKMLAFLQDMEHPNELRALGIWRAHRLIGDRRDFWSLHVTRNWRLTFYIADNEIVDLRIEDYH
ncbi:MAG: type II toxin-antitoxin system RelE/ParE family toxin [Gemmatimonadota bacterium]|nr:type II toxin-antitoxin system RelE/ParE family toxin [Gemmatimonadota bacterium]MDE2873281.1 type II toxin-antitoxin system RelE/ParE family toxin [Gemmatimonadota bacterium]